MQGPPRAKQINFVLSIIFLLVVTIFLIWGIEAKTSVHSEIKINKQNNEYIEFSFVRPIPHNKDGNEYYILERNPSDESVHKCYGHFIRHSGENDKGLFILDASNCLDSNMELFKYTLVYDESIVKYMLNFK